MQTTAINPTLKSAGWVALATALLLLVPLLAMQFGDEVKWTPMDFAVAGALLFGAGFCFVLLMQRSNAFAYRLAAALAVFTTLLLVWGNLAVGLIGTERNPANLMYAGVIAIEIIGAIATRGKSLGMSRALFTTAAAQALVAAIALIAGLGASEPPGRFGILVLNLLFVALFAASGGLFRAARPRGT